MPVQQEAEQTTAATVVKAALEATATAPAEAKEQESDDDFGVDFPGLFEAEELEEEDDVDDPVASGGDASLYGQGVTGNVEVEGQGTDP